MDEMERAERAVSQYLNLRRHGVSVDTLQGNIVGFHILELSPTHCMGDDVLTKMAEQLAPFGISTVRQNKGLGQIEFHSSPTDHDILSHIEAAVKAGTKLLQY